MSHSPSASVVISYLRFLASCRVGKVGPPEGRQLDGRQLVLRAVPLRPEVLASPLDFQPRRKVGAIVVHLSRHAPASRLVANPACDVADTAPRYAQAASNPAM